jgi:antitoxin component HigA of HigAB toxin-antitoxin module
MDTQNHGLWADNLYKSVCTALELLQAKRGDWGNDEDQRTELEKNITNKCDELWELIRLHPEVNTEEHDLTEVFDAYIPPTDEGRAEAEKQLNAANIEGLKAFLKQSKVKKKDFAAAYGCQPAYISRILSGQKPLSLISFTTAVQAFGFKPVLNVVEKQWQFNKI